MDAHLATKCGVVGFDALSIAGNILLIGKERKPSTPVVALIVSVILALELVAVWRWL